MTSGAASPQARSRRWRRSARRYSFRPWYTVSEFVMAGYPVPYPDRWPRPTTSGGAWRTTPTCRRRASRRFNAGMPLVPFAPGTFGGVTFQIEPADAAVYVDGVFAGWPKTSRR